jgi:uncharacterized membrane protein YjjP (DUF1212 family)
MWYDLSKAITKFVKGASKEVILFIDEVDKSSNNQLFLSFIGMLRNKYLSRKVAKDYTFKFFTGPVIGFIIGVFYTLTFTQDVKSKFENIYIGSCMLVGVVFFILLTGYYLLCKNRYCNGVNSYWNESLKIT